MGLVRKGHWSQAVTLTNFVREKTICQKSNKIRGEEKPEGLTISGPED
jgi:hypothetical protein